MTRTNLVGKILGVLLLVSLTPACKRSKPPLSKRPDVAAKPFRWQLPEISAAAKKNLEDELDRRMMAVSSSSAEEHARTDLALLLFVDRIPLEYLVAVLPTLQRHYARAGTAEYASLSSSLLARSATTTNERVSSLALWIAEQAIGSDAPQAPVYIRRAHTDGFRLLSKEVGHYVLFLQAKATSDSGKEVRLSREPEDLLALSVFRESCDDERKAAGGAERSAPCWFLDAVLEKLGDPLAPEGGPQPPRSSNRGGFAAGVDCFDAAGANPFSEAVARREAYAECKSGGLGGFSPDWFSSGGHSGSYNGIQYSVTAKPGGGTKVVEKHPDGSTHSYETFPGGDYAETHESDTQKIVVTVRDNAHGDPVETRTKETFGEDGQMTGKVVTRTTTTEDGVTTAVTENYDGDGNLTGQTISESTTEDGVTTTTTKTYDADGNLVDEKVETSETSSGGTENGRSDETRDPCAGLLRDDPRAESFTQALSGLDPLIIPSPDSVPPNGDPCFEVAKKAGPGYNCVSVVLCLDQEVDEECRCGNGEGGEVPVDAGACNAVWCADGKVCDPNTGVCANRGGPAEYEPGLTGGGPPPPVTELDLPGSKFPPGIPDG